MKKLTAIIVLAFGLCLTANADVWKWVDVYGKTHFVDTMTTIYTWLDEFGKVNYSDKPDHADAVSVELVWHSIGGPRWAPRCARMSFARDSSSRT